VGAMAPNDPVALRDGFEELAILNSDTYARAYLENIKDVMPDALNQILEEMNIAGQTGPIPINWEQPGIPSAQMPTQQQANALTAWLQRQAQAQGVTWTPHPETTLLLGTDKIVRAIDTDRLVLSMLLQDIKNLEEQQLEGVFNLPADMAALVPMTGRLYFSTSPINQQGGVGGFDWGDILNEPANNLDNAGDNLNLAAAALIRNARGYLYPEQETTRNLRGYRYPTQQIGMGAEEDYGIRHSRRGTTSIGQREDFGVRHPTLESLYPAESILDRLLKALSIVLGNMGGMIYNPNPMPETGGRGPGLQNIMPASIPITNRITFENQSIVYVDGQKIVDVLLKRNLIDFKTAKRRTGTVAYDVSA
jgi:hypothetical protein